MKKGKKENTKVLLLISVQYTVQKINRIEREYGPLRSLTACGFSNITFRNIPRVGPKSNLHSMPELSNHEKHTIFLFNTRGRHFIVSGHKESFHLLSLRHYQFNSNC